MNFKPGKDKADTKPRTERKKAKKITPTYLHNAGLYYLQRFAASRRHFEDVMMRKVTKSMKSHPEQDIEACRTMVQELAETFERSGLLNDQVYSRGMVTSLRSQGRSKRFIVEKLKHKGLSGDLVLEKITEHDEVIYEGDGDFYSALLYARRKKLGPFGRIPDEHPEKTMAKFGRAGFSYGILQKVMNLEFEEAEEMLRAGKIR